MYYISNIVLKMLWFVEKIRDIKNKGLTLIWIYRFDKPGVNNNLF